MFIIAYITTLYLHLMSLNQMNDLHITSNKQFCYLLLSDYAINCMAVIMISQGSSNR